VCGWGWMGGGSVESVSVGGIVSLCTGQAQGVWGVRGGCGGGVFGGVGGGWCVLGGGGVGWGVGWGCHRNPRFLTKARATEMEGKNHRKEVRCDVQETALGKPKGQQSGSCSTPVWVDNSYPCTEGKTNHQKERKDRRISTQLSKNQNQCNGYARKNSSGLRTPARERTSPSSMSSSF